jgi:dihydrofolate synthase / folylpolyglutamate synthase
MKIDTFEQAEKFLLSLIPQEYKKRFRGSWGIEKTKYFLSLLDNPQEKIKVIHIAGTSGKGSTSYLTSLLLTSHGKKTGLHLSPHLVDLRERFQINNEFLGQVQFVGYLNEILPAFEKVKSSEYGQPTYFEFLVVLAFYIFEKERVDYAVMETGLGGWYDATNVIENSSKVAVLTKIGFDHTEILGDTLEKIALQKAKIIQKYNLVISIDQQKEAKIVIQNIAQEQNTQVHFVEHKKNFQTIVLHPHYTIFDFSYESFSLQDVKLSLLGSHQVENASVALTILYVVSQRDEFILEEGKVRLALESARFPGRLEIFKQHGKTIIVDGAHNPQKMETFLKNLVQIYPNRKFQFIVAFKKEKDIESMLKLIAPHAEKILITSFFQDSQDMVNISEPVEKVAESLQKLNFSNFEIIENPKHILFEISKREAHYSVITGSLYLLSEIYPGLINLRPKS